MATSGELVHVRTHAVELLPGGPPFEASHIRALGAAGLHCGSGANLKPNCLNTDRLRFVDEAGRSTHADRLAKIGPEYYYLEHDHTRPLPCVDGVFDWVYSEHFIEHLSLEEGVRWLREMRRVLKVGGLMRLSTPDLRRYAEGYVHRSNGFFDQHKRHLVMLGLKNVQERPAWMINQIFRFWGHQWIYDIDEIRLAAAAAGFAADALSECRFQQGSIPHVAALDQFVRSDESLYVEIART